MSAPTLWEEGRWPSRRVIAVSVVGTGLLTLLNLAFDDHIGVVFGFGFVLLCAAGALAVRPSDFPDLLVLPPLEVLGLTLVLDMFARSTIGPTGASFTEGLAGGFAHMTAGLFVGYAFFLILLAVRFHVLRGGSLRLPSLGRSAHVATQLRRQRENQ